MDHVIMNETVNEGSISFSSVTIDLSNQSVQIIQEKYRELSKQIDSEKQVKSKKKRKYIVTEVNKK